MIGKMFFPSEALGAEGTFVRGLACMLSHVVDQVVLPGESLGAELALEGRLTRVLADMVHQVFLHQAAISLLKLCHLFLSSNKS